MAFKVGVQLHPQVGTVDELRAAWKAADAMGADSIWIWDHFFPLYGDPDAAHYEAYTLLAAMAVDTHQAHFGALVTCNSYRNPQLLADMARTIDLLSHGRFILGIGSGWFERDYTEYGYDFGTARSRLADLETALPAASPTGSARSTPPPAGDLPILIGGSGEKVTLRLVAEYADAWNSFGPPENFKHKNAVLDEWCTKLGRPPREVERTVAIQPTEVDDLDAYVAAGADHFIVMVGAPYDLVAARGAHRRARVTGPSTRAAPAGRAPGLRRHARRCRATCGGCAPTRRRSPGWPTRARGAWDALADARVPARGRPHARRREVRPEPARRRTRSSSSDLIVRRRPPDAERDEARIAAAADAGRRPVVAPAKASSSTATAGAGGPARCSAARWCASATIPTTVVDWLHRVQRTRGRRGWPEQAWQAEVVRRAALRGPEPA